MSFETTVRAFAAALGDACRVAACDDTRAHGRARRPPIRGLPQQCRGRTDRRARGALSRLAPDRGRRPVPRHGARVRARSQAALAGDDRLWRGVSGVPGRVSREATRASVALPPTSRGSRTPGSRPIMREDDRSRDASAELAASRYPDCLPGARIVFHPAARLLRFADAPPPRIWASAPDAASSAAVCARPRGPAKTRSSRVPTATSACASCRRWLTISL